MTSYNTFTKYILNSVSSSASVKVRYLFKTSHFLWAAYQGGSSGPKSLWFPFTWKAHFLGAGQYTGQTEAASLRQRTYHKTAHYCLNSGSEPSANDNESLRARRHAQAHAEPCGPTEMQILRRHQCWLEEWFEKVDWEDNLMPLTTILNRRSVLHQGAGFSPIQGNPVSLTNLTNYTAN